MAVEAGPAVTDALDKGAHILEEGHGDALLRRDIEDGGVIILRVQVQEGRLPGAAGALDMDLIDQEKQIERQGDEEILIENQFEGLRADDAHDEHDAEHDQEHEGGGQLREAAEEEADAHEQVGFEVLLALRIPEEAGEENHHGKDGEVIVVQAGADIGQHREGHDGEGVKHVHERVLLLHAGVAQAEGQDHRRGGKDDVHPPQTHDIHAVGPVPQGADAGEDIHNQIIERGMDHDIDAPLLGPEGGDAVLIAPEGAVLNGPEIREEGRMLGKIDEVGHVGHLIRETADPDGEIDLLQHIVKQRQAVDPQKDPAVLPPLQDRCFHSLLLTPRGSAG